MHVAQQGTHTWTEIDDAITRLAASKGALDVEIGRWLLVAQREGVERKLGFGSFAEYVQRRLGFDERTTFERLRVARALERLPALSALLRGGQRSWSAVRELTRVVRPETEAAWIEASERKTVREVQAQVAGREPGAQPWDPVEPLLTTQRLVFELPPDELAEWREAAEAVRREIGPAATSREVLRAMMHMALGGRPTAQPGYQTAVTLCAGCERTWQQAGGALVEVAPEIGDCARCDAEVVGVMEVEGQGVGDASEHVGGGATAHVGAHDEASAATAHVGTHDHASAATAHLHASGATAHVGTHDPASAATAHLHASGATAHVGTHDHADAATAHVGTPDLASITAPAVTPDEPTVVRLLGQLVGQRGVRVLTRVLAQVVGVPRTMTPRLRAAVRTRDRGRCVIPGCQNFRFVDLHHHVPRAVGGPHTLPNVLTLCTRHHRMVHEGVIAIERATTGGLVVRHAGGVLYGASGEHRWAPAQG